MSRVKVTYFDIPGSRGEEIRLALTLAGMPFDDDRIGREGFAAIRDDLPFGSVPVVEIPGRGTLVQTNAILRLIGRKHGLFPDDPFDAYRHDALMEAAEELRHRISATMRMEDPATRSTARRQLVAERLPLWGRGVESLIGDGPFVGGDNAGVADIKLYIMDRWISTGTLDDIPADSLDAYPRLKTVARGITDHPAVVAWYARKA